MDVAIYFVAFNLEVSLLKPNQTYKQSWADVEVEEGAHRRTSPIPVVSILVLQGRSSSAYFGTSRGLQTDETFVKMMDRVRCREKRESPAAGNFMRSWKRDGILKPKRGSTRMVTKRRWLLMLLSRRHLEQIHRLTEFARDYFTSRRI